MWLNLDLKSAMADVLDSRTIVGQELEALRLRIIDNMAVQGANASGATARSLRADMSGDACRLYGRAYFGVTETGRRPAPLPRGFMDILAQWAASKGIAIDERGLRSIYWSIVKHGTKLFRAGGRDTIYSKEIPKTIDTIKERLLKAFVERIVTKSMRTR